MADYDSDDNLVACVESLTCDVISSQPYWNMDAEQRAQWRRYTQQKAQRQRVQEQVVEEDEGEDREYTSEDEEREEAEEEEGEEEEKEKAPTKIDKRKLWVDYQKISRSELQDEQGKQKIPLSEVNDRARIYWKEDGHAKGS